MTTETRFHLEAAKFVATEKGIWPCTILLGTVGSTVHGTNVDDGVEDLDLMGVCIEPIQKVLGFNEFEQLIYRTAAAREQNKDARSKAGDVDMVIYSLRKYLRLALKGNPTVLSLLFVPHDKLLLRDSRFHLQELYSYIVSKRAGGAYLGYMQAQRQRLMGERGGRHGSRPELVNQFGYDSKYAAHVLRLGYQGVELLTTGKLTLPMEEGERSTVLAVRRGEVPYNDCLSVIGMVEKLLKDAIETTPLRDAPDITYVERWMIEAYQNYWNGNRI